RDLYRWEWAAAGEDRPTVRPIIGFLGRAFGARRRGRIRENDRTVVDLRHRLDHLPIEKLWYRADTDDAGRFKHLDRIDKRGYGGPILGKRLLEFQEVASRCHRQAAGIDQSVATPCLCDVHSLQCHRLTDKLRDAGRSRPAA